MGFQGKVETDSGDSSDENTSDDASSSGQAISTSSMPTSMSDAINFNSSKAS